MKLDLFDFTDIQRNNRRIALDRAIKNNLINLTQYNKMLKDMLAKYKNKPIA